MFLLTIVLLFFFSCFPLFEAKSLEADACVGIRRGDDSYDFNLPAAVAMNVHDEKCDAEWTVDKHPSATLEENKIHFMLPFKNVTADGIIVNYCPTSVKYHVTCTKYTESLTCSCSNSTASTPVSPADKSPISTNTSKRNHYAAYVVFGVWCTIITIIIFTIIIIFRRNRDSAAELNQPNSSV